MDGIAFQKMELPNGKTYIVKRSGIGDPTMEYVVNETSYHGDIFRKYGTYDECMDYVCDMASNCVTDTAAELSNMAKAVKEIATESFKRELG